MRKKLLSFALMLFAFLPLELFAFVPNEALTFEFNVETIGMNRRKEQKVQEAVELIRQVFASPEFRRVVLSYRYQGRRRFVDNRGLTNAQIYDKIMEGAERLYPHKNNTMDMQIRLYTNNHSNVLGYTYPNTFKVWLNTKYFNRARVSKIAGNLAHEWLHKLGFGHDYHRSHSRRHSVPYAIGNIVRKLAKELE